MCNWCVNKVKIKNKNVKDALSKYLVNINDELSLDFNKIIPMPESLQIECSSRSNDAFKLYLASLNPLIPSFCPTAKVKSLREYENLLDALIKKEDQAKYVLGSNEVEFLVNKYDEDILDILKIGEIIKNNILNYHFADWYDWSIANWGTKWNSSNTSISLDETTIYFDSAWSPSIPIIDKLASDNPELEIEYEWCEEQTGWYSGKYTYKNGYRVESLEYDSYSKEAYELSFELWGNEDSYKYNPEIDNYEMIDEDN